MSANDTKSNKDKTDKKDKKDTDLFDQAVKKQMKEDRRKSRKAAEEEQVEQANEVAAIKAAKKEEVDLRYKSLLVRFSFVTGYFSASSLFCKFNWTRWFAFLQVLQAFLRTLHLRLLTMIHLAINNGIVSKKNWSGLRLIYPAAHTRKCRKCCIRKGNPGHAWPSQGWLWQIIPFVQKTK